MPHAVREITIATGLNAEGVLYHAARAGITPQYLSGRPWFTTVQMKALVKYIQQRSYLVRHLARVKESAALVPA
jgi:hypothetical protein